MCNDIYTSPTGKMLDEKGRRELWKNTPLLPPSCIPYLRPLLSISASSVQSHPPPSSWGPLFPAANTSPTLSCYSRVQKERVYPQLLSAPGLWQHFLTFRICSRVSSERSLLFINVKALAKLDTSILCLFTGQVQDRQQQSEVYHAALHSTDLCNDPNFYRG